MSYKKQKLEFTLDLFWWGLIGSSFQFFGIFILCGFTFSVPCCDVRYNCHKCSGRLYLQLFTLFGFVCVWWCPTHIALLLFVFFFVLCFVQGSVQHILYCVVGIVCIRLVCPMLPVSLDCPSFVAPTVAQYFVFSVVLCISVFLLVLFILWPLY